jgi:hypothetical protein
MYAERNSIVTAQKTPTETISVYFKNHGERGTVKLKDYDKNRKEAGSTPNQVTECHQFNHILVRFEVFTAVTMKNGVFWVVTPCGSCKN